MIAALSSSVSGLNSQQANIDRISINLSNINTDGYKREKVSFADLLYSSMESHGLPVSGNKTGALQKGGGAKEAVISRDHASGVLRDTGRQTDLAISGDGYFKVLLQDGSPAYTRNGNFNISSEGFLVNQEGLMLSTDVEITGGADRLEVGRNGMVSAVGEDGQLIELGWVTLYDFLDPSGLKGIGGNLYSYSGDLESEKEGTPGQEGFGEIVQGSLESSNVDVTLEFTALIESQRAFQANARAIRLADELWGIANNLRK